MATTERRDLFCLIRDTRSTRVRLCSTAAALLIEAAVLTALVAAAHVAATRASSERLMHGLRSELAGYRMVLLAPWLREPQSAPPNPPKVAKAVRRPRPRPQPLSVPDTRLLDRLDPQIAGFVRDNPTVESVLTREIVRDLDARILDPGKLLRKSTLRVGFDLTEDGRVSRPRIEESSGVPSIDHLAIELAKTIGDYQLPPFMSEILRLVISIEIDEEIVIRLEGTVRKAEEVEEVRRQVQNALAFLRFAAGSGEGAFLVQDIAVTAVEGKVTLIRQMPKKAVLDLLAEYYIQGPR